MSHVTTVECQIKDLDALEKACAAIGLELVRGQQTYHWYGRHVGDYPVPEGFKANELGNCEHAIRVKSPAQGHRKPYEIGVVKRRDGKEGYTLLFDFWAGGYGLEAVAGTGCKNLTQQYGVEVASKALRKQGYKPIVNRLPNGQVQVVGRK